MSYTEVYGPFFQQIDHFNDNELNGWHSKLKKELDKYYNELKSNFNHRVSNDKQNEYLELLTRLQNCFKDLDQLLTAETKLTMNEKKIIINKLENFNNALKPLEDFVKVIMYSNKLECIILRIKAFLLNIYNCISARDLQYSRTTITGGGAFDYPVIIITAGPATHSTPHYVLPERSKVLLFFSKEIDSALAREVSKSLLSQSRS